MIRWTRWGVVVVALGVLAFVVWSAQRSPGPPQPEPDAFLPATKAFVPPDEVFLPATKADRPPPEVFLPATKAAPPPIPEALVPQQTPQQQADP